MRISSNPKASSFSNMVRVAVAALALCALALCAGCSSQLPGESESENTASQYMVNLNDRSAELKDKLEEFSAAASEQRISTMQAKAEEAYSVLDEMASIEAPESLDDLKAKYSDAATQLKDALSDYISLYTEVFDSGQPSSSESSAYAERVESIQKQYDGALNALEEADKMAAEK